jgi:hypothetical protein
MNSPNRIGSSYLIDHGSGRSSLRVVVEQRPAGWMLAVFQSDEYYVVYYDEHTLKLWDNTSAVRESNIRRLV